MSTNLHYKVHSTSGADKGQIYAACQYVSDALHILRRWPGRKSVIKYAGRIVWNNAVDKDGWMMDTPDWLEKSQELIKAREVNNDRSAPARGCLRDVAYEARAPDHG